MPIPGLRTHPGLQPHLNVEMRMRHEGSRRSLTRDVLFLSALLACSFVVRLVGRGQTERQSPRFDVAAIKQNTSGETRAAFGGPASRFTATNTPALMFITYAYRVQDYLLEGVPAWVKNDRWDINARAEGNFPATANDEADPRHEMVRALLVDRFKLSIHKEARERPIYALVLAKPGQPLSPRLHVSTTDCAGVQGAEFRQGRLRTTPLTPDGATDCGYNDPPGRISWGTQPMRQFAAVLADTLQRPVVDRTGLGGNFSAVVAYTPDSGRVSGADQPAADPNAVSIFTALQEQLGLKLEATRGAVDVIVIDDIQRPTPD